MNRLSFVAVFLIVTSSMVAQAPKGADDNAALRYWNAFAQLSDEALTDAQSKELESIANGNAPWNESAFGKLLNKNQDAVETMLRGTALPYCVWGVDYDLAEAAPIPQVGRGRALARLNVLTAERLAAQGKSREATDHLLAGVKFSRDLSSGMPLIGVLVGKSALTSDINVALSLARSGQLGHEDKERFVSAVGALPPDVFDWSKALHLEAAALHSALSRLRSSNDPSKLLESWGLHDEAALKDPRPTESDIQQVDAIFAEAERVFRQPASLADAAVAKLETRIASLKPATRSLIPSLRRTNDRRKEVVDVRRKVLNGF